MRHWLLLVMFLVIASESLAQTQAQKQIDLVGYVWSAKPHPMPLPNVEVQIVGGGRDLTTSSGQFRISIPRSRVGERLILQVATSGFDPREVEIPVVPKDSRQHPIRITMWRSISPKSSLRAQARKPPPTRNSRDFDTLDPIKARILVAKFESSDGDDAHITDTIVSKLSKLTDKYSDIVIQPLGEPITQQQGSNAAIKIGWQHNATIVIWGWYRKSEPKFLIDVHFEVLKKPAGFSLRQDNPFPLRLPIADFSHDTIHFQLADEMSSLTLLATGLARLQAKDYDDCISRLTEALRLPDTPNWMLDPSVIYSFRGEAYREKADSSPDPHEVLRQAISDFSDAIKYRSNNAEALISRGRAYSTMGMTDRALEDWNRVIDMDTAQEMKAVAYWEIVTCLNNKRGKQQAIDFTRKAIAVLSTNGETVLSITMRFILVFRTFQNAETIDLQPLISAIDQRLKTGKSNSYDEMMIVFFVRGLSYGIDGQLDKGMADLNRVIGFNGWSQAAYVGRAFILANNGRNLEAIAELRKATRMFPALTEAYQICSILYTNVGAQDQAISTLNQAIERNPKIDAFYSSLAGIHHQRGEIDKAIDDYDHAIQLKRGSWSLFQARSMEYEAKGDLDRAIDDLTRAINLKPDEYSLYVERARIYEGRCQLDKGIADLRYVISVAPANGNACSALRNLYSRTGELNKGLEFWNEYIKLHPQDPRGYMERSRMYKDEGKAIEALKQAIRLFPNEFLLYEALSSLYEYWNAKEAIGVWERFLDLSPKDEESNEARRRILSLKKPKGLLALFGFGTSLKTDEKIDKSKPSLSLAQYYEKRHEFDKAIEVWDQLITLNPADPNAYMERGKIHREKGDYDKAIADASHAITLHPNDAKYFSERSSLLVYMGELDKAIDDQTSAIRIYSARSDDERNHELPDKASTPLKDKDAVRSRVSLLADNYFARGKIYYDKGECRKSIDDWIEAKHLNPSLWDVYYFLSGAYMRNGEYDKAIALGEEFIRLQPASGSAYDLQVEVYEQKRDLTHACAVLNKAIKLNPNEAPLYYNRSNIYLDMGKIEEAITDLTQCLKLQPNNPDYLLLRGRTFLRRNKRNLAIVDLKKAVEVSNNKGAGMQAQRELRWLGITLSK